MMSSRADDGEQRRRGKARHLPLEVSSPTDRMTVGRDSTGMEMASTHLSELQRRNAGNLVIEFRSPAHHGSVSLKRTTVRIPRCHGNDRRSGGADLRCDGDCGKCEPYECGESR